MDEDKKVSTSGFLADFEAKKVRVLSCLPDLVFYTQGRVYISKMTTARTVIYTATAPMKKKGRPSGIELIASDTKDLQWIGEQYAVTFGQLRWLLGRSRKGGGMLSAEKTRYAIRRWKSEELVATDKLGTDTNWTFLTAEGMEKAELPYKAIQPKDLLHIRDVNWVRFDLEVQYGERLVWECERSIRKYEAGQKHYPDGRIYLDGSEDPIAIHVERSRKNPALLQQILGFFAKLYTNNWYFVDEETDKLIRRETKKLYPDEETTPFPVYPLGEVRR